MDSSKNWYNSFFFVKNEWGLPEKWDKLKELPSSLHVGNAFKIGPDRPVQPVEPRTGRPTGYEPVSHRTGVELLEPAVWPPNRSRFLITGRFSYNAVEGRLTAELSGLAKIDSSTSVRRSNREPLLLPNDEFVKVNFLQGEYKRRLEVKTKETLALESQLTKCRAELVTISTSLSFQNREVDLSLHELIEARAEIN
ncbi:hypothetical protein IEQ34_018599 [Dendrobium chrysotoxum]|uniref:Uncharacterized protein n=1 Tax=Dendrobium chrysotoxum TaxID=161865 RepID=A0AAV7G563_DENCH|nr:hypothetical protein IEQ34_018599 [Dendrobium chrysotoxum]